MVSLKAYYVMIDTKTIASFYSLSWFRLYPYLKIINNSYIGYNYIYLYHMIHIINFKCDKHYFKPQHLLIFCSTYYLYIFTQRQFNTKRRSNKVSLLRISNLRYHLSLKHRKSRWFLYLKPHSYQPDFQICTQLS